MTQLTYISYAFRILARDRLFSFAYGLVGAVLFFIFFLSIRIHFHLFGGISLTSIVSFDQSPQFLFYLSTFALLSLFFFHCLHNLGELGIMMAVGGNRIGCIWLHSLLLLLLFLPGFLLGWILNLSLPSPASFSLILEAKSMASALFCFVVGVFVVSFPTIGLGTFIDPYKSIRRQK